MLHTQYLIISHFFALSPALDPKGVKREKMVTSAPSYWRKSYFPFPLPFPSSLFSAQPLYCIFCFPFSFLFHSQLSFTFSAKYPHSILWLPELIFYLQFSSAPSHDIYDQTSCSQCPSSLTS